MEIFALILTLAIALPLVIYLNRLREKKRDTKGYFLFQVLWFAMVAVAFFYLGSQHFSRIQNVLMGAIIGGGLVYFFYESRRVFKK